MAGSAGLDLPGDSGVTPEMAARRAELLAEITQWNRAERDRLVRAGRRKPRTRREDELWRQGLHEREERHQKRVEKARARAAATQPPEDAPIDLDTLLDTTDENT